MRQALSAVLMLSACVSDSPKDSGTTTTATTATTTECSGLFVELGEGDTSFTPKAEGDTFTLVHGPQGGWHIDVAGSVSGTGALVRVHTSVVDPATGIEIGGPGQENDSAIQLASFTDCTGTFVKSRVFLDDNDGGTPWGQDEFCALHGNPIDLSVRVTNLLTEESLVTVLRVIAGRDSVDETNCAQ